MWLLERQEGVVTCKKPHQEEQAAIGDVGVTLFIGCWPGTAEGCPAPGSGASRGCAAGAGRAAVAAGPLCEAAHLALPLRALSAAVCLNKESCTTEASLPSVKVALGGRVGGRPVPARCHRLVPGSRRSPAH